MLGRSAKIVFVTALVAPLVVAAPRPARGADDNSVQQSPQAATAGDDTAINPAEPDFTLISLPTSLRLPRFGSAFRVTHRFVRPLTSDVDGLAADLFSLDSRAQIRLEYRVLAPVSASFQRCPLLPNRLRAFRDSAPGRTTEASDVKVRAQADCRARTSQDRPGPRRSGRHGCPAPRLAD
jgi:hypothetical protein